MNRPIMVKQYTEENLVTIKKRNNYANDEFI